MTSPIAALQRLAASVPVDVLAAWLSPQALLAAALADTALLAQLLESLRSPGPLASATLAAFPEAAALAAPMPPQVEHAVGSDRPLLDHTATRLLGAKLLGLEQRDHARFAGALSPTAFAQLADVCARVLAADLGPVVRAVAAHLDIAKTHDATLRSAWLARGITLEVTTDARAQIIGERAWPAPHAELVLPLLQATGLAGQHVRGESALLVFAPLVTALRSHPLRDLALDALLLLDACTTAAVREDLLDDALLARFVAVRTQLATAHAEADLAGPPPDRAWLVERLHALRAQRHEPVATIAAAVAAVGDTELAALLPALATCQLWYCEAATSGLSPSAQLGVLAAIVGAARTCGVDVTRPWHAQLRPLITRLRGDTSAVRYRLRLVEAAIAATPLRTLVTGGTTVGPLGTLSARLAHPTELDTIVVDYTDTDESAALVTLLGTYETRSQVAYHTMLKALCDLYGLRKDDFDRVANEANYLATMNAARSDKERMLDFVRPGTIVEIGPGGGVVLDLLAHRFPTSDIIGVDLSREVVTALEAHARTTRAPWRVVLGAAEDLATHVATADTVVFCSILHEVYSYAYPPFQLAAVERVVTAAYRVLAPGGRLVIRDGVMPPPGTRRIRMLAADVRPTLDLYCAQFEGRRITYRDLAPDRVELSAADAMEFLYTYTWGPASFPYEVRELYGILPYDAYVAQLLAWCGPTARVVDNPLRSYLQPGYRDHLRGKIELTDEHDQPVDLFDSNCLIVVEKTA